MALNLGRGWHRAGHHVLLGSRSPQAKAQDGSILEGIQVGTIDEALDAHDVVVIALPFTAVEGFAREHARLLRGRVVVDISNPFGNLPDNRIAGAEITAAAIGAGARVVAAFKDNFWETLLQPVDGSGLVRDVHFAGDDEDAKLLVTRLVEDLGFRPVDCGPLRNARVLDAMVPLLAELDARHAGGARRSSWKLLG